MEKVINRVLICLMVMLVIACTSKNEKVVEEKYPDNSPKILKYYNKAGDDKALVKEEGFYPNKKMRYSGEFKDNKRNGRWIYFYDNGKVWSEGYFKDGESDGLRIAYYENGHKRYEGNYAMGVRVGVWKFYDESGKQVNRMDYGSREQGTGNRE